MVAPGYQYSLATEYYAIRNAVSLLDTSPLFKYEIQGAGAARFLQRVLARDVGQCVPGRAQYTVWCDENGYVLQDGVVLRLTDDCFFLTAAEPTLRYFRHVLRQEAFTKVEVTDVSSSFGILSLQGPHAHDVMARLNSQSTSLQFFDCGAMEIAGRPVLVSRTGYTGDLGYELWIRNGDAEWIWDRMMDAGHDFNLIPIGTTAMKMARVEAGLLLMGVDFDGAKLAWVDAQRETPVELGWTWMFRGLDKDQRDFIGRAAIERALSEKTSRWITMGLELDWHDFEKVHVDSGVLPPKHEVYFEQTMSLYRIGDTPFDYAGYASSFLYSSLLKKPIALAKLPLDLACPGSEVEMEWTVIRKPAYIRARVSKLPFFNPSRKTDRFDL